MRQETARPLLITLAALAGVILLTVVVALLMRFLGGSRFASGRDTPYPYSWTEKKDGTITLTLTASAASDSVWSLGNAGGLTDVTVGETKKGKAKVTLTPSIAGREVLTFFLMRGEDRLAEVIFDLETEREDSGYRVSVIAHSERVLQSGVRGEDARYPFTVRGGEEGGLIIHIDDASAARVAPAEESVRDNENAADGEWTESGGDTAEGGEDGAGESESPEDAASAKKEDAVSEEEELAHLERIMAAFEERRNASWRASSSDALVASALPPQRMESGVDVRLKAGSDGTAEITVSKRNAGIAYVFTVRVSGGEAALVDSRVEPLEPLPAPAVEAAEEAEAADETAYAQEAAAERAAPDETEGG